MCLSQPVGLGFILLSSVVTKLLKKKDLRESHKKVENNPLMFHKFLSKAEETVVETSYLHELMENLILTSLRSVYFSH
ncbi:hypothetical protein SUSAZ_08680 [Sulfolobus acidocaldarius SUSAZ]|nr:hypothetical protein SUSAZ_08680 [Sulfolobus acidocaldarius SUSAZ]